jgi:hypothetical protein
MKFFNIILDSNNIAIKTSERSNNRILIDRMALNMKEIIHNKLREFLKGMQSFIPKKSIFIPTSTFIPSISIFIPTGLLFNQ